MKTKHTLELADLKAIAAAAEAEALRNQWAVTIAIVDDGGTLKHFSRMDNAFRASVEISQLKANTSSGFPRSTRQVGEIARERAPGIVHVPGIVTFAGGLPIVTDRKSVV